MADERSCARRELMARYEHPYRHALTETWRHQAELRRATTLAVVLWPVGAVGAAAGVELLGVLAGLGATIATVIVVLWLMALLRMGWRLTRSWRPTTELAAVRANRPQAGSEDPDVAHDEFAVTVEENGRLVTWRFRPLLTSQQPADSEIEVPGRPRYAASPVDEMSFDAEDTVRASEQLVTAQAQAAKREAAAAVDAHAALEDDRAQVNLAREARTTAAALQRVTGQRRRQN